MFEMFEGYIKNCILEYIMNKILEYKLKENLLILPPDFHPWQQEAEKWSSRKDQGRLRTHNGTLPVIYSVHSCLSSRFSPPPIMPLYQESIKG